MTRDDLRRRAAGLAGSLDLLECERRVEVLEVAVAENAGLARGLERYLDEIEASLVPVLERAAGPSVGA